VFLVCPYIPRAIQVVVFNKVFFENEALTKAIKKEIKKKN
jgi:hypothetical protein